MSKQQQIFQLIQGFAGKSNIIAVPVLFVDFMDSIEGGMFLSQLLYWSDKSKHGGWIYKTYDDWYREIRLTKYQIRKAAKTCEGHGFLRTKIKKANGSPTVHYRVDSDQFVRVIMCFMGAGAGQPKTTIVQDLFGETDYKQISKDCAEAGLRNVAPMAGSGK